MDGPFDNFPQRGGENEKKSDVRKERDNKHIHEESARRKRKRTNEKSIRFEAVGGLLNRALPEVLKSDLSANQDA